MPKVAIIDDENDVCVLLKQLLVSEGYDVCSETDSEQALAMVNREKPDCILLDVMMPKVSGMDILSKIKTISHNLPVVMITGYGNLKNAMESMKLGANEYITKPFDINLIKEAVKRCLIESKKSK